MTKGEDQLNENAWDNLASGIRATVGLVPLVGGALVELITRQIPNQRTERVVAYLRQLDVRMHALEADVRTEALRNPEKIDLIEEGAFQSARATSEERINRIATLVTDGLTAEASDIVRKKRLATLLGEMDDDELAILYAHGQSYGTGDYSIWDTINRPEPTHMQSSVADIDAEKLYGAGEQRLLRLGLLRKNYGSVRRGELPEFDADSGDFKHRVEISYLGRMLLRAIGQPSPYDLED